jgi:hypothetical protein
MLITWLFKNPDMRPKKVHESPLYARREGDRG